MRTGIFKLQSNAVANGKKNYDEKEIKSTSAVQTSSQGAT